MARATFSRNLRKFTEGTKLTLDQVHRGVVLELFRSVVMDTPVDTGRARANWLPSADTARAGTVEWTGSPASAMAKTQAEIQQTAAGSKFGEITIMVNNLPYIGRLENGSSKQAPAGMVRRNVDRVQSNVNRLVARAKREGNL